MSTKTARLTVEVAFDDAVTDAESVATALDHLLETALSTPGVLDECGNPAVGEFVVRSEGIAEATDEATFEDDEEVQEAES